MGRLSPLFEFMARSAIFGQKAFRAIFAIFFMIFTFFYQNLIFDKYHPPPPNTHMYHHIHTIPPPGNLHWTTLPPPLSLVVISKHCKPCWSELCLLKIVLLVKTENGSFGILNFPPNRIFEKSAFLAPYSTFFWFWVFLQIWRAWGPMSHGTKWETAIKRQCSGKKA